MGLANDQWLLDAGFTHVPDDRIAFEEQLAKKNRLHTGGPYTILALYEKGEVEVLFEQNVAPDQSGLTVLHPAVAVVAGPNGRAACNPGDQDLVLQLAADVA